MKRILFITVLSFISIYSYSQYATDAIRYSNMLHNGDARFMAMGGAFGALGANISGLSYNPAGIGLFRNGDASVTFAFTGSKNKAYYNFSLSKETERFFDITSAGVVLTSNNLNLSLGGGWNNVQIGFTFNQLKNFENTILISGNNDDDGIGQMFAFKANDYGGLYTSDLELAWDAYLIDFDEEEGEFYSLHPEEGIRQSKRIESWGGINELAITFGGNYNDKLFLGASIGIPILDYHEIAVYNETALNPDAPINEDYYHSAYIRDALDTKGFGVNLKIGAIYKANDMLRFGVAFHTPTYYFDLSDTWDTEMQSDFNEESILSPIGEFEYQLNTPMKAIGSVAFVFNKFGLISLDYEYVDYSLAKFDSDTDDFSAENADIKDLLKATSNLRLGTEWKFMNFSVRGGYAMYGSPFEDDEFDGKKTSYSFGLGYKEKNYYFDMAWVRTKTDTQYYLYNYYEVATNPATIKNELTSLVFTFGFRF